MTQIVQKFYESGSLENNDIGKRHNIEAVTLYIFSQHFQIDSNSKLTNVKSHLIIDRKTGAITQKQNIQTITDNSIKTFKYSAFLGIIPVLDRSFLVFVQDIDIVCTIEKHDIFEIRNIAFVPLNYEKQNQGTEKWNKIGGYLLYLKQVIFKQGFYFSYTYDLSLSRMKYAEGYLTNLKFCWNSFLSKDLMNLKDFSWMVRVIQGSIKTFHIFIKGKKLQYFLITRRSWKKGGTRYNARGLDEKGNVANFCQTEQIVIYNDFICCHLQIRGSVPAFWKQTGISAKVQFYRDHTTTQNLFKKHFQRLQKTYQNIFCVNLLAKNKLNQHQLTLYFQELVKKSNLDFIKYEFFDFHFACKGHRFQKSNHLLDKLAEVNFWMRFYAEDATIRKVIKRQRGVMRTNCLDCLDRTNYIQTKIAIQTFQVILKQLGINIMEAFQHQSLVKALDEKCKTQSILIFNFKNIWADNGDMISSHYTGTGSTHTNVTRTGKRDLMGIMDHGMKTLGRFYKQNVQDNYKQEVIDILLGEHTQTINLAQFEQKMKQEKMNEKQQEQIIDMLQFE